MTLRSIISGLSVVITILIMSLAIPVAAQDSNTPTEKPPTIETILAAMQQQNAATIEVHFTVTEKWTPPDVGKSEPEANTPEANTETESSPEKTTPPKPPAPPKDPPQTYIRTPEMLYLKIPISVSGIYEERASERDGVDQIVNIQLKASTPSSKTKGLTRTKNAIQFWGSFRGSRMETILFPLDFRKDDQTTNMLYGWIKHGKVSETMEDIDGHKCWKVDVTDTGDCSIKHLEIWLDPEIGYNPRRIKETGGVDEETKWYRIVDSTDYKEISKGIWFPNRQLLTMNWPKGKVVDQHILLEATELYGDKKYSKEDLKLKYDEEINIPGSE